MRITRATWSQVRREDSERLHSLGRRLQRQGFEGKDLTDGQEALFVQIISELEWRSRRKRRGYRRCYCDLCAVDFED